MNLLEKRALRSTTAALCAATLTLVVMSAARGEEKIVGTYGEVRTVLSFEVPDATVQKLVPEGWQVVRVTQGPARGANLSLILLDALVAQGPDGKSEPLFRAAALRILAKKSGMDTAIIMDAGGFESDRRYVPGAYNFSFGAATIERTFDALPDGTSSTRERWRFQGDNGNSLELDLQYARGLALRGAVANKVYSAMNPEFYRIYRIDQAEDVVHSVPTGTDQVRKFAFKVAGPLFAPLFDGSERLICITSIPWYTRQVSLPDTATQ